MIQNKMRDIDKYLTLLRESNLYSEENIVNSEELIRSKINQQKNLIRIFNQPIFKDGSYNLERFNILDSL